MWWTFQPLRCQDVATPRGCTYREHTGTRQGIGLVEHHETWSDVATWKYSLSHVDCLNTFLFGIEMASGLPFYSVYSLHLFCRVHVRCNLCIFSGVWQCLIDLRIEGRTATSNSSNHLLPTFLGDVQSQNGSFFWGHHVSFWTHNSQGQTKKKRNWHGTRKSNFADFRLQTSLHTYATFFTQKLCQKLRWQNFARKKMSTFFFQLSASDNKILCPYLHEHACSSA